MNPLSISLFNTRAERLVPDVTPTPPKAPSPARTFGVACALLFLAAADQTTVSTALPTIASSLGGGDQYPIVFTAYMAATAATVPIGGKLGDHRGRRPILALAVLVFTLSAGLAASSTSIEALAGARILQGMGAGFIIANAYAAVGDVVPMDQLGRYNGLLTGIFGLASLLGPILGGLLTDTFGWRSIFIINFPLGALAFISLRALPRAQPSARPSGSLDILGAGLLALCLIGAILTLGQLGGGGTLKGESALAGYVWILAPLTLLALGALVAQERRAPEPIISPVSYQDPVMSVALMVTFLSNASLYIVALYVPLFLQGPLGHSPTQAGLRVTPLVLSLIVFSVLGGIGVARVGRYRAITLAGLLASAVGIGALAITLPMGHTGPIIAALIVTGAGLGLALPSLTLVCQNAGAHEDLGISTGLSRTAGTIGGVVGVSLAGLMISQVEAPSALNIALTQAMIFASVIMALAWAACLRLADIPLRTSTSPRAHGPAILPLRGEHP